MLNLVTKKNIFDRIEGAVSRLKPCWTCDLTAVIISVEFTFSYTQHLTFIKSEMLSQMGVLKIVAHFRAHTRNITCLKFEFSDCTLLYTYACTALFASISTCSLVELLKCQCKVCCILLGIYARGHQQVCCLCILDAFLLYILLMQNFTCESKVVFFLIFYACFNAFQHIAHTQTCTPPSHMYMHKCLVDKFAVINGYYICCTYICIQHTHTHTYTTFICMYVRVCASNTENATPKSHVKLVHCSVVVWSVGRSVGGQLPKLDLEKTLSI